MNDVDPASTPLQPATSTPPVVLVVRDGWGENPHPEQRSFNAVALARTPVADRLAAEWPHTLIATSGEDVGLPEGPAGPTMGNSEVGHQNIGAGRIVDQELMRITNSIRDGSFQANPVLRAALAVGRRGPGRVHLLGLASDGQVHSDLDHLLALVDLAAAEGVPPSRLFVQAITDGRDTAPDSGREFLRRIEAHLAGRGSIASVMGRFWAMDRDHRWDRVERAWRCLVGPPEAFADSAEAAIDAAYRSPPDASRFGDEFIAPVAIAPSDRPELREAGRIRDGDAVILFNFRGDRPRELVKAFVLDDAAWAAVQGGGFERGTRPRQLHFATFTEYETGLPVEVVFPKPPKMKNILGEVVSRSGRTQFRCAETEKFPHVTFFFNDYREDPFPGERREIVPSPREVATYDLKPEMSAEGVCAAVLRRLAAADGEALLVVNFANPDMVGHTGSLEAAIRAVEVVDECVGRIVDATLARGGSLIVTADHGNAEQMRDPATGRPHTAHTNYTVPLFVVGSRYRGCRLRDDGRLADVAPTLLAMMGITPPAEMTGRSLLA